MTELQNRLFEISDEKYAQFQSKLCPTIEGAKFIGVRVPLLRKFAKQYKKEVEAAVFLTALPHQYYDENMLHSLLINDIKDYDECIIAVEEFLPYVDNWAVCDTLNPKVFVKNKDKLIIKIKEWISSDKTYTSRFGMGMLMGLFLDEDFKAEYHELVYSVRSEEYYVNMMIAWYFATALAKQYEATIQILLDNRLDIWTHNKTIQKAVESYRISDEQKVYLKSLKR